MAPEWTKIYKSGARVAAGSTCELVAAKPIESDRKYTKLDGTQAPVPTKVVIRSVEKKTNDMKDVAREVEIMKMTNHPNIIQIYETIDEPVFFNLVLELATGGDLQDRLLENEPNSFFTERETAKTLFALCDALFHLHHLKIVHGGIAPENLIFSTKDHETQVIKICDFGYARVVDTTKAWTDGNDQIMGYNAPEIIKPKGNESTAPDMWAVGVLTYYMLCGFAPWYDEDYEVVKGLICNATYEFPAPYWDAVSDDSKKLIKQLLDLDPKKRLSADAVKSHPWIHKSLK